MNLSLYFVHPGDPEVLDELPCWKIPSTKLGCRGTVGILGGKCDGEEEYGWGFWEFNIIV